MAFDENLEWNAGHTGCGELVMKLKIKLRSMEEGDCIKVVAYDEGAPEDLPAWCKLTGNQLVKSEHPNYWIVKKGKN